MDDPSLVSGLRASASSIWHESFDIAIRSVYPREQYEFTGLGSQVTDDMFRSFDPDKGVVALPKGQPNVLPSKEFPWDETKEKVLWGELLSGDKPLSAQVLHSLNVLWQDTLCTAHTDPMTIAGIVTDRVLVDKFNQTRQCRDWRDLEQFYDENPACFQSVGEERKDA
ncbi:hypothetical protein DPV78_011736 [Talaromyces pinophilus]|nr:hypothetical protein DPV78_011736 [Talaromyces pinophilus]